MNNITLALRGLVYGVLSWLLIGKLFHLLFDFKMSGNDSCGDATDLYPFIYSMYRVCVTVIYCWRSSLQLQSDSVSVTVESCAVYLVVLKLDTVLPEQTCRTVHIAKLAKQTFSLYGLVKAVPDKDKPCIIFE